MNLARAIQFVGLTIPLLAIFLQLNERISASQMLQLLVAAVCIFSIGYLMQRYSGGSGR